MKILHTADWHLGSKLHNNERYEEHSAFLNWLLDTIQAHKIDVLIVAGDIFDSKFPPVTATKLYFDFLKAASPHCLSIVIVGGNHDSADYLNAPRNLLKTLANIHIVGGIIKDPTTKRILWKEQIVEIKDKNQNIIAAVGAVPFLSDADVRIPQSEETLQQKKDNLKQGIKDHYTEIAKWLQPYAQSQLPIIATAHLYVAGSEIATESTNNHSIGGQDNLPAEIFPPQFNYVALGHIHKPQIINKQEHIRYSGAPIALNVGERVYEKQVIIAEFKNGKLHNIEPQIVPTYRQINRLKGTYAHIANQLQIIEPHPSHLPTLWLDIVLENQKIYQPHAQKSLQELLKNKNIEIINAVQMNNDDPNQKNVEQFQTKETLKDLSPQILFERHCKERNINLSENPTLLATFNELLETLH